MAVEPKTHLLSARVGRTKFKQVNDYADSAGLRQTELLRRAIDEYINNHPIKKEPLV